MIDIIPAIDIIEGKCVRLSQGDYRQQKVYNENPLEVAKQFEDNGISRLHLVDLDGAKANHIVNYKILEQIAVRTGLTIDFGGGIKSDQDLVIAFDCGADMVTGGSVAVKHPDRFVSWIEQYGCEKIILGADVKDRHIAINGWKESTDSEIIQFIGDYTSKGIKKVICTDIAKDGMLQGPSIDLYKELLHTFPENYLIASGGIGSIDDIYALQEAGVPAVIFGKAIYEGRITMKDLYQFIG